MTNFLLYTSSVLIWGSTWLAITFQIGVVDAMVSVAYRFILAALILAGFCWIKGVSLRATRQEHFFLILQGACLFAFNYWLVYLAEEHLASGVVAVLFSTMVIMNTLNSAFFFQTPIRPLMLAGAGLGILGTALVFREELVSVDFSKEVSGLLLALSSAFLASLGNILAVRNQRTLSVLQINTWGMAYGALLMLGLALGLGKPFLVEWTAPYLGSLVYLALFGSVVAFGCYLVLIQRIGVVDAGYATLLIPLVALVLSTIFEEYHWTGERLLGVGFILLGNLVILRKKAKSGEAEKQASALSES